MDEVIVSRLRDVGFSLYEARLYLALLRVGAQNGNEVAKAAGVPSSKVYAALDKLAGEGVVQTIKRGSSTRFAAVPPGELVQRLRKHYNTPLDFLEEELPKVQSYQPSDPFLTVSGEVAVRDAAVALIDGTEQEIHISCWEEEIEALRLALANAHERGVRVFGMLYGEVEPPPGEWLRHHYEDIVGERVGGRLLALVADEREAVIARVPTRGEATGVRSRNPVMTMIVQEYLHHDNVLQRAQINFGFEEWDRWWTADPHARAEILGHAMKRTRRRRSTAQTP